MVKVGINMSRVVIGNQVFDQEYHKTLARFHPGPWPEKSAYKCHHCCHHFDSRPIFIPCTGGVMRGNYCGFSCALADTKTSDEIELLHTLYRNMTGLDRKITPAPPRNVLVDFGGNMDITEFREGNTVAHVLLPNIIPAGQISVTNRALSSLGSDNVESRESTAILLDKMPVQGRLF